MSSISGLFQNEVVRVSEHLYVVYKTQIEALRAIFGSFEAVKDPEFLPVCTKSFGVMIWVRIIGVLVKNAQNPSHFLSKELRFPSSYSPDSRCRFRSAQAVPSPPLLFR